MDERTFIQLGLMMALKPAQVALELSRSTSTITRELKRNEWIPPVKTWVMSVHLCRLN